MKIGEIQNLLSAIRTVQAEPGNCSVHFSYALAKNARVLQAEMDTFIESANKGYNMEKFVEWDQARDNLRRVHEKTSSEGDDPSSGNDLKEIEKIIDDALEVDFPGITAQVEERRKKIVDFEKENIEVDLFTIPLERVPELPASTIDRLYPLIRAE